MARDRSDNRDNEEAPLLYVVAGATSLRMAAFQSSQSTFTACAAIRHSAIGTFNAPCSWTIGSPR
jgi:hypothetical protein